MQFTGLVDQIYLEQPNPGLKYFPDAIVIIWYVTPHIT